jgi:hypothetical protein
MAMIAKPMTISALSVMTGVDRRTIGKRLAGVAHVSEDGRAKKYAPGAALQAIYLGDGDQLDPMQERARKDKIAADLAQLRLDRERKEVLSSEEVEAVWQDMTAAFRAKVIQLPATAAPRCAGLPVKEIRKVLEGLVHTALQEIKDYDVGAFGGPGDRQEDLGDDGSAPEADG